MSRCRTTTAHAVDRYHTAEAHGQVLDLEHGSVLDEGGEDRGEHDDEQAEERRGRDEEDDSEDQRQDAADPEHRLAGHRHLPGDQAPEVGHVLRELVDQAAGRGQQHLEQPGAEDG